MTHRILITGLSGGLSDALAPMLAADCAVVHLRSEAPRSEVGGNSGTVVVGSVTDEEAVAGAMDGVDTVIHCASYPGAIEPFTGLMETNVLGTFTVLEEAGRRPEVERFIYLSSLAWHGLHEQHGGSHLPRYLPVDEEHPSLATGYFDSSKVQAEYLCSVYAKRFKKPVVALRPGWVISKSLCENFRALVPAERPHLNDYVGIDDLVDALRRSLDYEPKDGFESMLIHAEDQRSTCPSLELVERFFGGITVDVERLERCEGFGALVNCDRARQQLGWQPNFRCRR